MRGLQFALVVPALLLIACGGDTGVVAPDNVSPALRGVAIAGADGISDVLDWDRDVVAIRELHAEASLSPDGAVTGHLQESYNSIIFRKGTARMEHELLTMTRTAPAGAALPLRSASGQ